MEVIKSPQDNIEAYLYNVINIELYEGIERFDTKEKLFFFNVLFKEFEFFCENSTNYLSIINYFETYNKLPTPKDFNNDRLTPNTIHQYTWFLYSYLDLLIKDKYPINTRTGVLIKTCEHIEKINKTVLDLLNKDRTPLIENTTEPAPANSLNWQGTPLQFTELTKALFETKLVSPELTQKEFFKRMKLFFNIDEFNERDKIKEIVNRSSTPFINILEITLNNFKTKQLEKRKNN